jgi:hypothetical protein
MNYATACPLLKEFSVEYFLIFLCTPSIHNSSLCVVTGHRFYYQRLISGAVSLLANAFRSTLEPCPPFNQSELLTLSPRKKWQVCEADNWPPPNAEVKNGWSFTSTPNYVFMLWCLKQGLVHSVSGLGMDGTLFSIPSTFSWQGT